MTRHPNMWPTLYCRVSVTWTIDVATIFCRQSPLSIYVVSEACTSYTPACITLTDNTQKDRNGAPSFTSVPQAHARAHASCPLNAPVHGSFHEAGSLGFPPLLTRVSVYTPRFLEIVGILLEYMWTGQQRRSDMLEESTRGGGMTWRHLQVLSPCHKIWGFSWSVQKVAAASDVLKIFSFRSHEIVDNFSSICLLAELQSNFLGQFSIV